MKCPICGKPSRSRFQILCNSHYRRQKKYGDPFLGNSDMEDIIRPKEEFFDGRFERLNSFEYDNGIIMLKNSGEF